MTSEVDEVVEAKPLNPKMRGFFIEFDEEILNFINNESSKLNKCEKIIYSIGKILKNSEKDYLFRGLGDFYKANDVKQACEFYLRYLNPELLQEECPEYYQEWVEYFVRRVNEPEEERKSYIEWLFRLAFKDVLNEKGDCK